MASEEGADFQQAALDAALDLNRSIKKLNEDTKTLKTYGMRNRFLLKILGFSIVFNLVLSIILGWVAITALGARSDVKISKLADYQSCLETNRIRLVQVGLWEKILDTIGIERLPEANDLKQLTAETFQPRLCKTP